MKAPILEGKHEVNVCKCGHGRDRHSEHIAGAGNKGGFLCLISDCSCWSYKFDVEVNGQ